MEDEVELALQDFRERTREAQGYCFTSIGREFQAAAVQDLRELKARLGELKRRRAGVGNEDAANTLLSLEYLVEAIVGELQMWTALKDDRARQAWDHLVGAQVAAGTAIRAHTVALSLNAEAYAEKLELLQRMVFPFQAFMSVAVVVESAECSICGAEDDQCEHVKGRPYMGEMCGRRITKIREMREVSLILPPEEPADRRCRITSISDGDVMRDKLTWRAVGPVPEREVPEGSAATGSASPPGRDNGE